MTKYTVKYIIKYTLKYKYCMVRYFLIVVKSYDVIRTQF